MVGRDYLGRFAPKRCYKRRQVLDEETSQRQARWATARILRTVHDGEIRYAKLILLEGTFAIVILRHCLRKSTNKPG